MSPLIQVLTLCSGLLVNFLIPLVFGLEQYGAFIKANIVVFLFQRMLDIVVEPLIAEVDVRLVFPVALVIAVHVLVAFMAAGAISEQGSSALLGAMLFSSTTMLAMYANGMRRALVAYLSVFVVLFCTLLGIVNAGKITMSIETILIVTNLVPACGAAIVVTTASRRPRWAELSKALRVLVRRLPYLVSLTLVFNLLTNVLPFVLSKILPLRDLGLYRVIASVVQSATAIFPINTKAILAGMVGDARRRLFFFLLMGVSLAWFSAFGAGLIVVSWIDPRLSPYLKLICSLPILYWAVLTERFLVSDGRGILVSRLNLTVAIGIIIGLFFIKTIDGAVQLVSVGFSAYMLALQIAGGVNVPRALLVFAVLGSVVAPAFAETAGIAQLIFLSCLFIGAIRVFRLGPSVLRSLGGWL